MKETRVTQANCLHRVFGASQRSGQGRAKRARKPALAGEGLDGENDVVG